MATVTGRDDVITEAGGVEEERGARGTSPLPSVANDDENNDPGDPPAYPGNEGEGQEMVVIGRGATKVEEPTVTFIARDETSESSSPPPLNYDFSVSTSLESVYSTFAGAAGYVGGTFSLIWKKTRGSTSSTEDEQEVFEKSTATLFETGMEGGKEYLVIRKKDGVDLEKKKSVSTYSSSVQGSKVTPTTLNNVRSTGGGNYGSSNYSSSYGGYSNYSYNYSYKSDTGYVGLVNQAMTCYLNSLLQTLYMTPEFRNALYQWRFTSGDDGAKCIPYQLQKLFIHLQTSEKRAVETTDVTKSFGWDSSEAWQQHDVQELCRVMFDALEKRFKKDKHDEADLINHLYQGTLQDYVKCLECGYESAREDHFLDIPLVIKPFGSNKAYSSVKEALEAFVEPETLTEDNQYQCEQCQKKCDAHKGLKFKSFPYLLTLQLKRFDFDYSTMHRIKLNDRMTFPRILDLNQFVLPEDMPSVPDDVEEMYRDFVVEEFDPRPPPYNYYGRSGNTPSYSNAVSSTFGGSSDHRTSASRSHDVDQTVADSNNDESGVADSNDEGGEGEGESGGGGVEVEGRPTELTVGQRLRRGPYVYELFSIMIHSGSAIGGHYYAYIKSFADKKWYCFNDQSVSKLNEEDIEGTFGGPDSRSRGYYSSMYASSANAYMLMYRRIDRSKNNDFLPKEDLPLHVLDQIEEDRLLQEEKRRLEEYERSLCKFRLFARHLVSGELMEKKIEVQNQWSLEDTVTEAHKILELQDVVPVSRCRLVRYDEYSECLDQSFDENEGMEETFCMMVGGPRNYYSFELFLEIRAENEVFKQYNRGGLNLKILLVNLETLKVALPVAMRAEQSWTVLQLKEAVSEKFGLLVETMNLAVETYQNEGRHLAIDSHQLKHESLFKKHTIFACSDPEDFRKPFKESEMNKLIDVHVNSILLYVTIPPPPQRPAIATTTAETTEERDEEREGGVVMESSVDKPGEQPTADNEEGPPATSEGVGTVGSEISPPEAPPPTEDTVDMTKERPLQRTIEVRIDRRSTLQDLKNMLVEHVQQPVNNFKIYRLYSNNQEYEMSRLNDHLNTMPRETQLIVRLGRALQAGEVRVRLSLLRMEEAEFCKPLMDSIVTKGMTVGEFKKQLVREAYKQGIEYPLQIDRLRLRKKTWRTASTIYLDDQVFERDIHVFANFEIYVEPLKGLEPMTSPDQMQIYLKRWHPSTYTVDPPHEIILDQNSPAHLRMRISEASGIPQEHVMFGKAHNSFPGEVSVLDLDDDLEWNPKVSSISSMPLSIYDDGAVLYYKDGREKLMDLTAEKKNEIVKNERTKSTSHSGSSSSYRYHAKEKALKIYTEDDEEEEKQDETANGGN